MVVKSKEAAVVFRGLISVEKLSECGYESSRGARRERRYGSGNTTEKTTMRELP
jgi:hypothetical protein